MELSSYKLKKLPIFQERTCKVAKTNKKFTLKNFIVSCDAFGILNSERSVSFSLPFIIGLIYLKSKDF